MLLASFMAMHAMQMNNNNARELLINNISKRPLSSRSQLFLLFFNIQSF